MSKKNAVYEIGSDNIFADLELDSAEDPWVRAQLGHTVRTILIKRKLTQRKTSALLEWGKLKFLNS